MVEHPQKNSCENFYQNENWVEKVLVLGLVFFLFLCFLQQCMHTSINESPTKSENWEAPTQHFQREV